MSGTALLVSATMDAYKGGTAVLDTPRPWHRKVDSMRPQSTCTIDGCDNTHVARGRCAMHYEQLRRAGELDSAPTLTGGTLEERLQRYSRRDESGCLVWIGTLSRDGYGIVRKPGSRVDSRAHRVSYEMHVGPIPEGLSIDHLCRNRPCIEPTHLEPVTARENTLRGVNIATKNKAKTHCKNGHPFDEQNTRYRRGGAGRDCRECQRLRYTPKRRAHGPRRRTAPL